MLYHWVNRDGIDTDGSKLLSDCISAAVHTFDVGTDDYVCNDFVWLDHGSFSIAIDSEHEPPAVAVEAPRKELRQRSDLDRLIEQARSELLFKKTSG